jgi:lysophospholipase L1-like esterase
MRILLVLVLAFALALVVAAFAVTRDDDAGTGEAGSVTLVGDSLNVGIEPHLRDELAGWRVDANDRVGRTTREGIDELRRLGAELAPVVVVSLGTNDLDGSEEEFRALVEEAVEIVGPERCLLWATIVRDGGDRTGFDRVLHAASAANENVRLVDWAEMVAQDDSLLAVDLVHATPEGYARRAEETARAVRACPRTGG